jgi:TPR repeat protein
MSYSILKGDAMIRRISLVFVSSLALTAAYASNPAQEELAEAIRSGRARRIQDDLRQGWLIQAAAAAAADTFIPDDPRLASPGGPAPIGEIAPSTTLGKIHRFLKLPLSSFINPDSLALDVQGLCRQLLLDPSVREQGLDLLRVYAFHRADDEAQQRLHLFLSKGWQIPGFHISADDILKLGILQIRPWADKVIQQRIDEFEALGQIAQAALFRIQMAKIGHGISIQVAQDSSIAKTLLENACAAIQQILKRPQKEVQKRMLIKQEVSKVKASINEPYRSVLLPDLAETLKGIKMTDSALVSFFNQLRKDLLQEAGDTGNIYAMTLLAHEYWQEENFSEHFKWDQKASDHGVRSSQYNIGIALMKGQGIKPDPAQSALYILKAAEQGYANAQNQMGLNYQSGIGVPIDLKQAVYFYALAAAQNHAEATHNLGDMYLKGQGVKQDYSKALSLFKQAARQNVPLSFFCIGKMYYHGYGVDQDLQKALDLFRQAAQLNIPNAHVYLGRMFARGEGLHQDLMQAAHHYDQAALYGDNHHQRSAALFYLDVMKDTAKGLHYLNMAAKNGNPIALYDQGYFRLKGLHMAQNIPLAIKLLKNAASKGSSQAVGQLGVCYFRGTGVPVDYVTGFQLTKEAAALNDPVGFRNLGEFYRNGIGTDVNMDLAYQNLKKAIELGETAAYFPLGLIIYEGYGMKKPNPRRAMKYFL